MAFKHFCPIIFSIIIIIVSLHASDLKDKYNSLNLHYDHCRHPMAFNKDLMKCECPPPLKAVADTCVCIDCIFEEIDEKYTEGNAADVPTYISEALEELDKEMGSEDVEEEDENHSSTTERSRQQKRSSEPIDFIKTGREAIKRRQNTYLVNRGGKYHQPGSPEVALRANLDVVPEETTKHEDKQVKILKEPGQTFSEGIVGGAVTGSTRAKNEKAVGTIESYKGTGALALGSGGGSVGGAAFTGSGASNLTSSSKGATAEGSTYIGNHAKDVSSTTTVLAGLGSATAVNAKSGDGTASGAATSTNETASAATAAFGKAASAASAAGEGGSAAGVSAGDNAKADASATGDGPAASSSSVGDANEKMATLENKPTTRENKQRFTFEATPYDFDQLFTQDKGNKRQV